MWLTLLVGCDAVQSLVFDVHETGSEVRLTGYVYRGPFPDADDPVVTGSGAALDFFDREGTLLASAEEPYASSYPGYWQVDLPPSTPFQLEIVPGGEGYPALWLGESPPADGLFPATAPAATGVRAGLFGWPAAIVDPFFAAIDEAERVDIEPLDDGQVTHLWGGPEDRDAIRGDRIRVFGGDGEEATVYAYAYDDDTGALVRTSSTPVDYFLAFNLTPGEIIVQVDSDTGEPARSTYLAVGGEIVAPWFFRGP